MSCPGSRMSRGDLKTADMHFPGPPPLMSRGSCMTQDIAGQTSIVQKTEPMRLPPARRRRVLIFRSEALVDTMHMEI